MVRDVVLLAGVAVLALGSLSLQDRTMERLSFVSDTPVVEVSPEVEQAWLQDVYARCAVGEAALTVVQARCLERSLTEGTGALLPLVERLEDHYLQVENEQGWLALMARPEVRPRGIGVGPSLLARDVGQRLGMVYDFACARTPAGARYCWNP